MITLLSTVFGLVGSLLPNVIKIFEKKQDYAHELALKRLEYDAAREGILLQQQVEAIKADTIEGESVRKHDIDVEYTGFWAALRASIRPVITYSFFILFCGIKIAAFIVLINRGASPTELLSLVWDSETMAIFSAIIGFWFGSRAIEKFSGRTFSLGSLGGTSVSIESGTKVAKASRTPARKR